MGDLGLELLSPTHWRAPCHDTIIRKKCEIIQHTGEITVTCSLVKNSVCWLVLPGRRGFSKAIYGEHDAKNCATRLHRRPQTVAWTLLSGPLKDFVSLSSPCSSPSRCSYWSCVLSLCWLIVGVQTRTCEWARMCAVKNERTEHCLLHFLSILPATTRPFAPVPWRFFGCIHY